MIVIKIFTDVDTASLEMRINDFISDKDIKFLSYSSKSGPKYSVIIGYNRDEDIDETGQGAG